MEKLEKKIDKSLDNCLRLANSAVDKGIGSLRELTEQGEILEKISGTMDNIHRNNEEAKNILDSIASIFGKLKRGIQKELGIKSKRKDREIEDEDKEKEKIEDDNGENDLAKDPLFEDVTQDEEDYGVDEDKIDQILELVMNLREISMNISEELDKHMENTVLIDDMVENETITVRKNTVQINDIIDSL